MCPYMQRQMAKPKKQNTPVPDQFVFRRNDSIGATDADEDAQFLSSCYVDTGDLGVLRNCSDPRRIVLGRTGSGKTALLNKLCEREKVIRIEPESLSLPYICSSNILQVMIELDANLDLFFRMLWRHVFAVVELIRERFGIQSEGEKRNFTNALNSIFRRKQDQEAIKYLQQWGDSFWETTDYRIKELTSTLEQQVKGEIGAKLHAGELTVGAVRGLTTQEKAECRQRAQNVIGAVQVKALSDILEALKNAFDDVYKPYYVVVDRLDEDWVDDQLRYRLVRALIETVRDFKRVANVKIIIALRFDLLERVVANTDVSGFQEEKYESLYLTVDWSRDQLTQVLDKRIEYLVKQRYTNTPVSHNDLLPVKTTGVETIDYMLDRTLMRPRDVIQFFNYCIRKAIDQPKLDSQMVMAAELDYSRSRIEALRSEWAVDYPHLVEHLEILRGRKPNLRLNDITDGEVEDFCMDKAVKHENAKDALASACLKVASGKDQSNTFRKEWASAMFRVGAIGLKLSGNEPMIWSTTHPRAVLSDEIPHDCRIQIHPMLWRGLNIAFRDASVKDPLGKMPGV